MESIKNLISQTRTNPQAFKALDSEITKISSDPLNYEILKGLMDDPLPECHFYAMLILEKRLKIIASNPQVVDQFVIFLNYAMNASIRYNEPILNNKLGYIYALTTVFFYPVFNVNFFELVSNAIVNDYAIGYIIFKRYLMILNISSEISSERRTELRRSGRGNVTAIIESILSLKYNEYTMDILTNALINVNAGEIDGMLDYALKVQGNEVLDFFCECLAIKSDEKTIDRIIGYATQKADSFFGNKMVEILVGSKKEVFFNIKVYEYVIKLLESNECFVVCLEFLSKGFKYIRGNQTFENISLEVVKKVIVKYAAIINYSNSKTFSISNVDEFYKSFGDDVEIDYLKNTQEELIRTISIHYPRINTYLLKNYPNDIPRPLAAILLKNCAKKSDIVFQDPYLILLQRMYENGSQALEIYDSLDFNDHDTCKLVSKLMKKHKPSLSLVLAILNKTRYFDSEAADEITVSSIIFLSRQASDSSYINKYGTVQNKDHKSDDSCEFNLNASQIKSYINDFLGVEWSDRKMKRFHSFMRKDHSLVSEHIPSFYSHILASPDFGLIFSILGTITRKFNPLPSEILLLVYNSIPALEFKRITPLINDLINVLDEQTVQIFLPVVYKKIVDDFDLADQVESQACIRSFTNFIERHLAREINLAIVIEANNSSDVYAECLVELLNIKDRFVVRRVHEILKNKSINLNNDNLVYKLLVLYNSSDMVDAQNEILAFLVDVIENLTNLNMLLVVPNSTQESIIALKDNLKGSPKTKKDILREFLKDVRGKGFDEICGKRMVIQKIGFERAKGNKQVDVADFFSK